MPYFVISDGRDTFVVELTDPDQVAHARALIDGTSTDSIHVGGLVTVAPANYNIGWSFHVRPEDVAFYDSSAEIGDAPIADVEEFVQSGRPLGQFLPHNSWGSWATFVLRELHEIAGTSAADVLSGTAAHDILFGKGGSDQLAGGEGDDHLAGGDGNDLLRGGRGDDKLGGGAGDDRLEGGAGNDVLEGGAGADRLLGGAGNDIYIIDGSSDVITEYADQGIDLVKSPFSLVLGAQLESLKLLGAEDLDATGNALANLLIGNSGDNLIRGLDGDDLLFGDGGDDRIASGSDVLDGGSGADMMEGGRGNDIYFVDNAADQVIEHDEEGTDWVNSSVSWELGQFVERLTLTGTASIDGSGNDLANLIAGNAGANVLRGMGGNDWLQGARGDDQLHGGAGDDSLTGGSGNDRMYGGIGHDILSAGAGADFLDGADGNDLLSGGAGQDRMYGGSGSDRFLFDDRHFGGATAATADVVHDFSQAEHDLIDLGAVDSVSTIGGDQGFAFVGTAAFSGTAGELRYEQIGGNTFVQGDTDGDGVADFWIRLDGLHTLGTGDFVL